MNNYIVETRNSCVTSRDCERRWRGEGLCLRVNLEASDDAIHEVRRYCSDAGRVRCELTSVMCMCGVVGWCFDTEVCSSVWGDMVTTMRYEHK